MNTTLSQIFDDLFTANPYVHFRDDVPQRVYRPKVNIIEHQDGYLMEFSIPGIKKEDIKIDVEEKTLTISYEHIKEEAKSEEKVIRKEFANKSFKRNFTLGDTINTDAISASFENGILTLTLPKNEVVKPVKKSVNIA